MRTVEEYRWILELWAEGYNKKAIARLTEIPRRTVIDCIQRYGSMAGLEQKLAEKPEISLLNRLKSNPCDELLDLHQAYAYLLGIYLGDGSISKFPRVYRLRVSLDYKYPDIIERCRETILVLLPNLQIGMVNNWYKGHISNVDVSCYYKYWPDVFPQHDIGPKHEREIKLEPWQQRIVDKYPLRFFTGLYHSDGSRSRNIVNGKDYPRYTFANVSYDIVQLFCDRCDALGIHWTDKARMVNSERRGTEVFIAKRKDVEYLDRAIASNFYKGCTSSKWVCRDSLLAVRRLGRAEARPYESL